MTDATLIDRQQIQDLGPDELRQLVERLLEHRDRDAQEIAWRNAKIDKLTFEVAQLRRLQFGRVSERMNAEQRMLFEEAVAADIASAEEQLAALQAKPAGREEDKKIPKRATLPANLPRREVQHEPENTTCRCGCAMKRIGEDVSEKLDYTPGVFTVERHVRGKWAAVVMSLVQSAKMNGHDPWQYLRDVLARLPTHLNSRIEELLPHRWQPSAS